MELVKLSVDWKEGDVSMFTMDGVILARSKDSDKGKLYEEIARRANAYPKLIEALELIRDSQGFNGGTFVSELQGIARTAITKTLAA